MGYNRTDQGNAESFGQFYKDKIRFDHLQGRWLIWTGTRWKPDDNRWIERLAKAYLRHRIKAADKFDPDTREKEIKWVLFTENHARFKAMINDCQKDLPIADDGRHWDEQPYLLGTDSGVVDLNTGTLRPGRPEDKITKTVGYKYDPAAECPLWDQVFKSYWDDDEIRHFVHKSIGYSVSGLTSEQCLFTLYGLGENGKSAFLDCVYNLLGDYSYTMPFSTIELMNRSAISNDVAALVNKRFVMSSETQEDMRLNEGRIKSITGDATLTARFMYKENFTFRSTAKLWLAFNHKPRVHDDSHGFWRRIRMVPMEKVFSDSDRIPNLEKKLKEEQSGILAWAIRGFQLWLKEGMFTPPVLQEATDQYRLESDPLKEFLDDKCRFGDGLTVAKGELFAAYRQFVRDQGEKYPLGKISFGRRLSARGINDLQSPDAATRTRLWDGIDLSQ